MRPDSLAVIGLGAIGGSLAWQARLAGVPRVVGYSPIRAESVQALKAGGLTDIAESAEAAAREASLVILAAPPGATLELIDRLGPALAPEALLSDVTSVKAPVVARAVAAGLGDRFAGAHPLAGTHGSGWEFARPDRFRDGLVYVTATGSPNGDRTAGEIMHFWAEVLEAHPVLIDAAAHDRQLAWTSHLPQAVAFGLARVLAARELGGVSFGAGARDTTRLAGSNPDLWVDIFLLNGAAIVEALEQAEGELRTMRELIVGGRREPLREFLADAWAFRRTLE
ncbi:MAG: prephenate dehydrogenase [Gemmatimonadales bacterium]